MNICPLCNGLRNINFTCDQCGNHLEDTGRIIDYFDDYSAYMEIDDMKKSDGYASTLSQHECAHLFYCSTCKNGEVRLIKE
ncbi:hypothetical protein [Fredinandcohnia quinoae]|uniref:Uncharacterized protein n=1 Tax=Fredinandcohnia quinoae TaxID=2918902 RepID=A0AAW5EBQ4_9BACI|nr:hypothetical protein [Fredinandcohnia sp. SECRCQ15]MCH1627085.1 hypothetical protein [Fredinandcohnia sp. SECRCQ15]